MKYLGLLLFFFITTASQAANQSADDAAASQALPQYSDAQHLGVATCANVVCHSINLLEEESNIRHNEYPTWLFHDPHASSYKTLLSQESKTIARKLGIASAAQADICLDCHADNVPAEKRGVEFHITDGVGCEACHGGSEKWISSHTIKPYNGQRNLNHGMYPTAPLASRAKLCVSCHVGSEKKLANHNIMGAGHPRLSFELDTFSIRQPEHYTVDEDYIARKNPDNHLNRLLVGTTVHAQAVAANLSGKLLDNPQGHPEIALFDCHSCHQSLNKVDWQRGGNSSMQEPGMVSLNDSSFILLAALTGAVDASLQAQIINARQSLNSASSQSTSRVSSAAKVLYQHAVTAQKLFLSSTINDEQIRQMLKELMYLGVRGDYQDYIAAEQAVMAMDALSFSLPADPALRTMIDQAYQLTKNDEAYKPSKLKQLIKDYRANK